ncbi:MAG: hypothetical protein IT436_16690 [Phycisphaerales bacterium]|nr:hypothetical protein [Phycisphaerales bacterium]
MAATRKMLTLAGALIGPAVVPCVSLLVEMAQPAHTVPGGQPQPVVPAHAGGADKPGDVLSRLQVFPADNAWNQDVSGLPVHPMSTVWIATMGAGTGLHPDFGTVWDGAPNGIPFVVVPPTQPMVPIDFVLYGSQSDPGPYPVPPGAPIEGGPGGTGDRHVLVVDWSRRMLYELYRAFPIDGGARWRADSGAVWDLTSNELRPFGWTSADAAGLAIFPGLARYDEAVLKGEIRHALRFTTGPTQKACILPATHWASSSLDPTHPPMGLRVRLKAGVDISGYPPQVRPILAAMKKYGMILADNGSDWYVSGAPDPRWDDDQLSRIRGIKGSDFECVDTGPVITP